MTVFVQQCAAAEAGGKGGLQIGCCCRVIEGDKTCLVFCNIVHSAAYSVYKRRQRGLREPLGSSKDSSFDGIRGKRREMTRTGCAKRRRVGAHTGFEDYAAKDRILERCTKGAYKKSDFGVCERYVF